MIVVLLIAGALFTLGMLYLPDTLVMQVQADGTPSNTLPKLIGLLIPLVLSCVFAVFYYKSGKGKNLFVALIGLAAFALTFYFNR